MKEKAKVLDILKVVIDDFQLEYEELKRKVEEKELQIQEKQRYLLSFVEKEESDFKIFSPRNVESVFKEEIEEKKAEIDEITQNKKVVYKKMGFLSNHINKLNMVYENVLTQGSDNHILKEEIDQEYLKRYKASDREEFDYRLLVMDMLEKERLRLARELHDSTIQEMTHVIHVLELAQKFSEQDPIRSRMELQSASRNIRKTIEDLRNKIFDLRPMSIEDLGYEETFSRLKAHIENISDIKIKFTFDRMISEDSMDSLILYRIIQECCMNAVKHSNATKIEVFLKNKDEQIFLEVTDDGIGFDVKELENNNKHNFGLEMTKERTNLLNGKMEIVSEKTIGTTIFISFPKDKILLK